MIRFALLSSAISTRRIAINPAAVTSVLEDVNDSSACRVFTVESVEPVTVAGSFDEVVAALEAAGAPAVAPVVEVAPTDLERAADVLEELARAARTGSFDESKPCVSVIDRAVGVGSYEWDDTADALIGLAARLRGAR